MHRNNRAAPNSSFRSRPPPVPSVKPSPPVPPVQPPPPLPLAQQPPTLSIFRVDVCNERLAIPIVFFLLTLVVFLLYLYQQPSVKLQWT